MYRESYSVLSINVTLSAALEEDLKDACLAPRPRSLGPRASRADPKVFLDPIDYALPLSLVTIIPINQRKPTIWTKKNPKRIDAMVFV